MPCLDEGSSLGHLQGMNFFANSAWLCINLQSTVSCVLLYLHGPYSHRFPLPDLPVGSLPLLVLVIPLSLNRTRFVSPDLLSLRSLLDARFSERPRSPLISFNWDCRSVRIVPWSAINSASCVSEGLQLRPRHGKCLRFDLAMNGDYFACVFWLWLSLFENLACSPLSPFQL